MKSVVALIFLFPALSLGFEPPIQSVNGVRCGVTSDNHRAVPTGTSTYLYSLESSSMDNVAITLDLKLEFLLCTTVNSQFAWVNMALPRGLYSYTQRVTKKNNRWVNKGYWDTTQIALTDTPLAYDTKFKPIKISKLLTSKEHKDYLAGKTLEVFLKLDVASERYSYFIDGFMVLKIVLNKTKLQAEFVSL